MGGKPDSPRYMATMSGRQPEPELEDEETQNVDCTVTKGGIL